MNGNNQQGGDAAAKTTLQIGEETSATNNLEAAEKASLVVSPNPVGDAFSLIINELASAGEFEIEVWNSAGQPVFSKKINLETGRQTIPMAAEGWPQDIYFVKMSHAGQVVAGAKLVKVGT